VRLHFPGEAKTKEPRDLPGPNSPPARLDTKKLLVHRLLLFPLLRPSARRGGRRPGGAMWVFYLISLPLTLGMVVVTLRYFAGPAVPRYVVATVGYAWFCSLSIIILVPADIWTVRSLTSSLPPPPHPLPPVPFIAQLRLRWFGC
jgi:hypothetical protein